MKRERKKKFFDYNLIILVAIVVVQFNLSANWHEKQNKKQFIQIKLNFNWSRINRENQKKINIEKKY